MTRLATKAADSVFYKARMAAAEHNEHMNSREGAAVRIGIDRTRLARIELGMISLYPEEVVMMADAYNAPEIMNHYCTNECPIGKRMVPPAELRQLDRMTINILNAVNGISDIGKAILAIDADGQVTPDEVPQLQKILQAMQKVSSVSSELQIWMEKYVAKDGDAHGGD